MWNMPTFIHALPLSAPFHSCSLVERAESRTSIPCPFESLAGRATDSLWDTVTWKLKPIVIVYEVAKGINF